MSRPVVHHDTLYQRAVRSRFVPHLHDLDLRIMRNMASPKIRENMSKFQIIFYHDNTS